MLDVTPATYDNSEDVTLACEILPLTSVTSARLLDKLLVRTVLIAPGNAACVRAFVKYMFAPSATAVVDNSWKLLSPRQYCDAVPVPMTASFPPS